MRVLSLLLLLLSMGISQAQNAPAKYATSFYCFQYAEGLQDVYVQTGSEKFEKVELSTANMVGPIGVVASDGVISVHRKEVNDEGVEIYPPVGKVKMGTKKSMLVVLMPDKKGAALPYRGLAIDRAAAKFPLGSYQFLNLCPHNLRGLVGKTKVMSKPGSVQSVRPTAKPGEMMTVLFEYHDGKQWRTMTKTRWAYRDQRRSLICAYLDPKDKRMKMRSIPERLVPAAPADPKP